MEADNHRKNKTSVGKVAASGRKRSINQQGPRGVNVMAAISFLVGLNSLNQSYNELIEIPERSTARMRKWNELNLSGDDCR